MIQRFLILIVTLCSLLAAGCGDGSTSQNPKGLLLPELRDVERLTVKSGWGARDVTAAILVLKGPKLDAAIEKKLLGLGWRKDEDGDFFMLNREPGTQVPEYQDVTVLRIRKVSSDRWVIGDYEGVYPEKGKPELASKDNTLTDWAKERLWPRLERMVEEERRKAPP